MEGKNSTVVAGGIGGAIGIVATALLANEFGFLWLSDPTTASAFAVSVGVIASWAIRFLPKPKSKK